VVEIESGVARCPFDPLHNSTALYVGTLLVSDVLTADNYLKFRY